jgi:hypothetical protein
VSRHHSRAGPPLVASLALVTAVAVDVEDAGLVCEGALPHHRARVQRAQPSLELAGEFASASRDAARANAESDDGMGRNCGEASTAARERSYSVATFGRS